MCREITFQQNEFCRTMRALSPQRDVMCQRGDESITWFLNCAFGTYSRREPSQCRELTPDTTYWFS